MATGTVTTTEEIYTSVKQITWEWTSTAGGLAGDTSTAYFDGEVVGFITDPDAVAAPTASYDIVITDAAGYDVLAGQGANRSASATEYVTAKENLGAVCNSRLTLAVTNAGDTKKGKVILQIR